MIEKSPSIIVITGIMASGKSTVGYGVWSVEQLDAVLRNETPRIGMWLDSSELSSEETVTEIIKRLHNEALIL